MPIKIRLPTIDLAPIDELIAARRMQWNALGTPATLALNKSGILILSALLEGHIEQVFLTVCECLLPHLKDEELEAFGKSIRGWGNPSADRIDKLFARIGVCSLIEGITWQKTDAKKIRSQLKSLNEMRNRIAHGKQLDGSLKLSEVEKYRAFIEQFSINLHRHLHERFGSQLVVRKSRLAHQSPVR